MCVCVYCHCPAFSARYAIHTPTSAPLHTPTAADPLTRRRAHTGLSRHALAAGCFAQSDWTVARALARLQTAFDPARPDLWATGWGRQPGPAPASLYLLRVLAADDPTDPTDSFATARGVGVLNNGSGGSGERAWLGRSVRRPLAALAEDGALASRVLALLSVGWRGGCVRGKVK